MTVNKSLLEQNRLCNWPPARVMSSRLCKNPDGAVFPFQVDSLEAGINDAIYTLYIHKTDYRPRAPTYINETTLNDVGGAQFTPQMLGNGKERE